jgi:hypothetical protein
MNWKQWKIGLLVAASTGLLSGFIGLAVGVTWRQAGYIVGMSIGKDLLLYLTDSTYRKRVIENLPGTTDTITITQTSTTSSAQQAQNETVKQ